MSEKTLGMTLTEFSDLDPDLSALVLHILEACKEIAAEVRHGAFQRGRGSTNKQNIHGDTQKHLDIIANDIFTAHCRTSARVAALVSEEEDEVIWLKSPEAGDFVVCFDPLDGSSNIEVGMCVGTIFSVFRLHEAIDPAALQQELSGRDQVFAGYALYGPATELVVSDGKQVDGYCLEPDDGTFRLIHPEIRIDPRSREVAINASRRPLWPEPITRYIDQCFSPGEKGLAKSNMRWTASMVADIHRILMRGGIFLYPEDAQSSGRLRLVYELNPIAFLIETAGGKATDGRHDILSLDIDDFHQRNGAVLGAREDVEEIRRMFGEG
ncbi:class 1 fructose-bisphosphatase [Roseibium sp. M-1]